MEQPGQEERPAAALPLAEVFERWGKLARAEQRRREREEGRRPEGWSRPATGEETTG